MQRSLYSDCFSPELWSNDSTEEEPVQTDEACFAGRTAEIQSRPNVARRPAYKSTDSEAEVDINRNHGRKAY